MTARIEHGVHHVNYSNLTGRPVSSRRAGHVRAALERVKRTGGCSARCKARRYSIHSYRHLVSALPVYELVSVDVQLWRRLSPGLRLSLSMPLPTVVVPD